jgi:predicted metal-dependent hydrolase
MEYSLKYSKRKTVSLTVKNGELTVRAPFGVGKKEIEKIINKHSFWIEKNVAKTREKEALYDRLSEYEIEKLRIQAKEYFKAKMKYFSEIMDLKYGRITITSAKTRFGSCSQSGNICFSYRLMLYPEKARDYVVVHELSHLVYMNHSPKFYALIEKYLPDYKERKSLLKLTPKKPECLI